MNQVSSVPFGTDATVFQGYAESANDRLGAIDFVFENTGPNWAYIRLAQYDGVTSPSGFATIDTTYTTTVPGTGYAPVANFLGFGVAPGGTSTRHYVLLSKRVAFFGSGNTNVNISAVLRNKSDLRGAQIDIVAVGRRSWGYDEGWNRNELIKKWGSVAGPFSTQNNTQAGPGNINPNGTTI
jgi:hypothetical protein